jgi:hypothetical protein
MKNLVIAKENKVKVRERQGERGSLVHVEAKLACASSLKVLGYGPWTNLERRPWCGLRTYSSLSCVERSVPISM